MSFFKSDVRVEKLAKWLDWAGEIEKDVFVALPMIQRGSVWKPGQIIDLWDSLLQGMPIGSLMISELQPGTPVRRQGQKKSELVSAAGGLGLIDGQQRTLAMLAAWPLAIKIDRRIWVDFADTPVAGHLLTLRVTSTNHPFGFRRDDPSLKLSLDDRRKAQRWHNRRYKGHDEATTPPVTIENAWPYSHSTSLPIDLRWLIETWRNSDPISWEAAVLKEIETIKTASESSSFDEKDKSVKCNWPMDAVLKRIKDLGKALTQLFEMELPLIRVDNRFFGTTNIENIDPPLALLFKRIGTGGTKLSDADYVYSIIKHLHTKTYDLVESLYEPTSGAHNIASLLNSTDLVMSAVRIAVADWRPTDGKLFPDRESPSKQDFHKLLGRGDFLQDKFLPLIEPTFPAITSPIVLYFDQVQKCLEYVEEKNDIGLPRHLFPHIGRPLVQVLLRVAQSGYLDSSAGGLPIEHQKDMVRLVLFWMVAVDDRRKASEIAFRVIKSYIDSLSKESIQLGKEICMKLIEEKIAVKLIIPSLIEQCDGLAISSKTPTILSSNARFITEDNETKFVYDFYRRWWQPWTYHHPMLLWLQREHVATMGGDPMAGRDEDTPYDYDHILPYSHWGDWRGPNGSPPSFHKGEIRVVGHGIGNVRVWDSSSNSSDGDDAPAYKLKLMVNPNEDQSIQMSPTTSQQDLLRLSAIPDSEMHKSFWQDCSAVDAAKRVWSADRVSAFQAASESRAFHLYERYFSEPNFAEWFGFDVPPCAKVESGQLDNKWAMPTNEARQTSGGQSTALAATPDTVSVSVGYQGSPWGGHSSAMSVDSLGALYYLESQNFSELVFFQNDDIARDGFVCNLDSSQRKLLYRYVNDNIWNVPEGLCGGQAHDARNMNVVILIGSEEKCWSSEIDWGPYDKKFQGLISMLERWVSLHRSIKTAI
jgi:hypothetical protein